MGRFLLGFAIGAAIGSVAVLLLTPKSGDDTRESINVQLNTALENGRKAAAARERELWDDFYVRIKKEV